jgi:hypothetical protein
VGLLAGADPTIHQTVGSLGITSIQLSARKQLRRHFNELFGHIDIEFVDPGSVFAAQIEVAGSLEAETRVLYDFDEMLKNRRLKNLFFDALDSHVDQLRGLGRMCDLAAEIDGRLNVAVSD